MLSHQELANNLKLFMFSEYSPGSCIMLPHGQRIYNRLMDLIKEEYYKRGYDEVSTPIIYKSKLWEKSGHWDHYRENMFQINVEDDENQIEYALKAMNCPGHCLIFDSQSYSYRDLPIKLADFGILHRNESSGSLRGLTRVRKFAQDDAHIFCRDDQIETQINECLDFLDFIYKKKLGLNYEITLSTRPDKFIGDIKRWESAEKQLENAIKSSGFEYTINEKDGAFYGPKIDVMVKDSMDRKNQCGTIQLDLQLPKRFGLKYATQDGEAEPVIIHRAIFGSFERFIAIILESTQGHLPMWLSPRQVAIIPIACTDKGIMDYCESIKAKLKEHKIYVDFFDSDSRFQHKIAHAEVLKYNCIIVIGNTEVKNNTINVRENGKKKGREINIQELVDQLSLLN